MHAQPRLLQLCYFYLSLVEISTGGVCINSRKQSVKNYIHLSKHMTSRSCTSALTAKLLSVSLKLLSKSVSNQKLFTETPLFNQNTMYRNVGLI